MENEYKSQTAIPASEAQCLLKKMDRRDKLIKTVQLFMLLAFGVFSAFLALRLQVVIDQNQKDTLVRSEQARKERNETKDYIKCILLVRFDYTPEQLKTREGVERALDICASKKAL